MLVVVKAASGSGCEIPTVSRQGDLTWKYCNFYNLLILVTIIKEIPIGYR